MKESRFGLVLDAESRICRLERQIERERAARLEAEAIAERGLRELYNSQQRLTLLQRITDGANRAMSIRDALDMAIREICTHMGWDFGNAYLVEDDAAVGCDCWFAGRPDRLFAFVEASRQRRFARGVGMPGRILANGQAIWIDDVARTENFPRAAVATSCDLVSACGFPVLVGEEVTAVLEFFSRKALTDRDAMMPVMVQIGTQIGRVVERERAREALVHDALHDMLTGLPNRTLLNDRGTEAFHALPATREGLAMLVIDLNGFKAVNDRHGHLAGDRLLIEVADRLSSCLSHYEAAAGAAPSGGRRTTLARTGGDEFVLLVDGLHPGETMQPLARALADGLAAPMEIEGEQVQIGASIGIAYSGPTHQDLDQLLRDADLAMYQAKEKRLDDARIFTYSEEIGEAVRARATLESSLRDAIAHQQFVLHYQPIVRLTGERTLAGFEALVRWNHPQQGLLAPGHFIEVAEQSRLIIFIGDWVLREACRAIAELHRTLPRAKRPFISINIAPAQFLQPNFVDQVRDVLMSTCIDPTLVRLEITEGVAILDAARTARIMGEFKSWGMRTSLDDFGTGFSSLSYLQKLPFDSLKIDRSFVAAMGHEKSRNIVRTILDLANIMEMGVVAEGIEHSAQDQWLSDMGCDLGQGYLYGHPLPQAEAFALTDGAADNPQL